MLPPAAGVRISAARAVAAKSARDDPPGAPLPEGPAVFARGERRLGVLATPSARRACGERRAAGESVAGSAEFCWARRRGVDASAGGAGSAGIAGPRVRSSTRRFAASASRAANALHSRLSESASLASAISFCTRRMASGSAAAAATLAAVSANAAAAFAFAALASAASFAAASYAARFCTSALASCILTCIRAWPSPRRRFPGWCGS